MKVSVQVFAQGGDTLESVIERAVNQAYYLRQTVLFVFNGIGIEVDHLDRPQDIRSRYQRFMAADEDAATHEIDCCPTCGSTCQTTEEKEGGCFDRWHWHDRKVCPYCLSRVRADRLYVTGHVDAKGNRNKCTHPWHGNYPPLVACPTCGSKERERKPEYLSETVIKNPCRDAWHDTTPLPIPENWKPGTTQPKSAYVSTCPTCGSNVQSDRYSRAPPEGVCLDTWHDTTPASTCPTCGSTDRQLNGPIVQNNQSHDCMDEWHSKRSELYADSDATESTSHNAPYVKTPDAERPTECPGCGSVNPNWIKSTLNQRQYVASSPEGRAHCMNEFHAVHRAALQCPSCQSQRRIRGPGEDRRCGDPWHIELDEPVKLPTCPTCSETWKKSRGYFENLSLAACKDEWHILGNEVRTYGVTHCPTCACERDKPRKTVEGNRTLYVCADVFHSQKARKKK